MRHSTHWVESLRLQWLSTRWPQAMGLHRRKTATTGCTSEAVQLPVTANSGVDCSIDGIFFSSQSMCCWFRKARDESYDDWMHTESGHSRAKWKDRLMVDPTPWRQSVHRTRLPVCIMNTYFYHSTLFSKSNISYHSRITYHSAAGK